MKCETCKEAHEGIYGSGRFCSQSCANKFSSTVNKENKNKNISKALKGFKCIKGGIVKLCDYGCGNNAKFQLNSGKCCCEDHRSKCPKSKEKNSKGVKKAHKENRMGCGYIKNKSYEKGIETYKKKLRKLYETLPFDKKPQAERRRIVLREQESKCLTCGIYNWNNKPLTLHLDHIDGNNKNDKRKNLRYLCPNCHSQTETYCGSNIKKGTQRKVSDEKLIKALTESKTIHEALIKVGLVAKGGNYIRAKKLQKHNQIRD